MTQVRLAPLTDYTACQDALEAACGDLSWVTPGMKIAVKVNLVSGAPPEKAITTHPSLVAALTKLLIARGAEVVVGDSPGGLFTPAFLQWVYHLSGYEAVKEAGATLNLDCATSDATFPQGAVLHQFTYTKWLTDCDAIINFCKLKSHCMTGLSGGVKNLFGCIPGLTKPEFHWRFPNENDFADMLLDLCALAAPRLSVMDAVVAMEGNGPTSGKPRQLGLLLGSEDPFALDEVCAQVLGCTAVPTLEAARALGRVPEFTVTGGDPAAFRLADFVLPPLGSTLFRSVLPGKAGELLGRALEASLAPRPMLTGETCVGCGKCASICPAKAITMVRGKPKIHRKTCIRCFCCQEFCPKGALKAQRTRLARLLSP